MIAAFSSRSDGLSAVRHGTSCVTNCTIKFAVVSVLCFFAIAIAAPALAYGQDQSVQTTPAALAPDAQRDPQPSGDAADAQTPQTQAAKPQETQDATARNACGLEQPSESGSIGKRYRGSCAVMEGELSRASVPP